MIYSSVSSRELAHNSCRFAFAFAFVWSSGVAFVLSSGLSSSHPDWAILPQKTTRSNVYTVRKKQMCAGLSSHVLQCTWSYALWMLEQGYIPWNSIHVQASREQGYIPWNSIHALTMFDVGPIVSIFACVAAPCSYMSLRRALVYVVGIDVTIRSVVRRDSEICDGMWLLNLQQRRCVRSFVTERKRGYRTRLDQGCGECALRLICVDKFSSGMQWAFTARLVQREV